MFKTALSIYIQFPSFFFLSLSLGVQPYNITNMTVAWKNSYFVNWITMTRKSAKHLHTIYGDTG